MTHNTITTPIVKEAVSPTNPLIKSFYNSDVAILEFLTDDDDNIMIDEHNKGVYL